MAGPIPGAGETQRIALRLSDQLLNQYDEGVVEGSYDNRSEAIREAMRRQIDLAGGANRETDGTKRVPPDDPDLAKAWDTLKSMTSADGWVTEERALSQLAQEFGMAQKTARHSLVKQLDKRGYVNIASDMMGRFQSYRVLE